MRNELCGFKPGETWWIVKHTKKSKELYPRALMLCDQLGISDLDMGKHLKNARWNRQIGTRWYSNLLRYGKEQEIYKEIERLSKCFRSHRNALDFDSGFFDGIMKVVVDISKNMVDDS